MRKNDQAKIGILFARMGYALSALTKEDRLLIVSLMEQASEHLREDYANDEEQYGHEIIERRNIG